MKHYHFFILMIIVFFSGSTSVALEVLKNIPDECHNNKATHQREGSKIDIGPTWVEKCENVCVFDENGKITGKETHWFPRRSCDENKRFLLTNICAPSKKHADCYEIQSKQSDSSSYDCKSHSDEKSEWRCIEKQLPVKCEYKFEGKSKQYRASTPFGYCQPQSR